MNKKIHFHEDILKIRNIEEVGDDLRQFIREQIFFKFKRKGAVIGISGGIDSALTCALCVKAVGSENVLGLIMPEKDSNSNSVIYAKKLCEDLNVRFVSVDITHILSSFGVYSTREQIIRKYFPDFDDQTKYRIIVPNRLTNNSALSIPHLEVLDSRNKSHRIKLTLYDYLDIVASTNIKHRTRMAMLYYHAEKNHLVVAGTTNKSEMVQGYYVKYGDGGVDIDPLANLYKTQVYQLSNHLGIPNEIIARKPSPDTWNYEVSDEDFFYGLPYKTLDLIWFANENSISTSEIAAALRLTPEQIELILDDQKKKWNVSQHMREIPPQGKPKIVLDVDSIE